MKTFLVYQDRTKLPSAVAVKKGFSWSAFLVGPLWYLLNGMWLTFLLSVAFFWGAPFVTAGIADTVNASGSLMTVFLYVIYAAIWVATGLVANLLLCQELEHKGYKLVATVRAKSASEAIDASTPAAAT